MRCWVKYRKQHYKLQNIVAPPKPFALNELRFGASNSMKYAGRKRRLTAHLDQTGTTMGAHFFSANSPAYAWMSIASYAAYVTILPRCPVWVRAAVFFPATVLHEFLHAIGALHNLASIGSISFKPKKANGRWSFGSITTHGAMAKLNASVISAAPAVLGSVMALMVVHGYLLPKPHSFVGGMIGWYVAYNLVWAVLMTSDSDIASMGPIMRGFLIFLAGAFLLMQVLDAPLVPCRLLGLMCPAAAPHS